MTFRGLFIGVDNYQNPGFRALGFAKRDAIALHALLSDNYPGPTSLVLDSDATKDRLLTEMRQLGRDSEPDDFVMITFSGHGTRTAELATHDADPARLADTAVRLDEFTELIDAIPSKRLLVALDCCFSGSALAKVLPEPQGGCMSRSSEPSPQDVLSRITGSGRLIFTATGKDQEAQESRTLRHGLLSYYLIRALLGDKNLPSDGKIRLGKLTDYLFTKISSHRLELKNEFQEPRFGGWAGDLSFPVLRAGPRYHATGDSWKPPRITHAFSSLGTYGIHEDIIAAWRQKFGKLNDLQVRAVNEAVLLDGNSALVSAPTSAGKTMIGEIASLRAVAQGRKAVFLLPTRALVNDQYDRFVDLYSAAGVRTIRVTGELRDDISRLFKGSYELAILTYEKYIGLLSGHPELLDHVGVLVVDEIHALALPERGPLLEMLFTWIKMRKRRGHALQIVGLSAVLDDADGLADWLDATPVRHEKRETVLREGVIGMDGRLVSRAGPGGDRPEDGEERVEQFLPHAVSSFDQLPVELTARLVEEGDQVIVFRATRHDVRTTARSLARRLGLPSAKTVISELPQGDDGQVNDLLRECLARGVAFHVSDLSDEERRLLEQSFKQPESGLRVLVSTTTLAQGVNLPADSVVICELEHPGTGERKYSVPEYKNMAGRAGRKGLTERGRSFVLAESPLEVQRIRQEYVLAAPGPIRSALRHTATDLRSSVLSAFTGPVAHLGRLTDEGIEEFFTWTFAAYQHRCAPSTAPFPGPSLSTAVAQLIESGFLEKSDSGLALTRLGEISIRSGLSVDSIDAVVQALKAVPDNGINRMTLICAAHLTAELHDVRFEQRSPRPDAERKSFESELKRQGVPEALVARVLGTRQRNGSGHGCARSALACLMWTRGMALSQIERAITLMLPPTARSTGPVRQAARRAADVMGAVLDIAAHVCPSADLGDLPDLLPVQLELGIPKEFVPLARHTERRIPRPVYLSLLREGFETIDAIVAGHQPLLLDVAGGDNLLLRNLLDAATAARAEADRPDLSDLLPLPVD
ncbi:DEAD/DEAH box helicase [Streptomyces clavuligerus]|uniref:DEAD/DEAH box helicase domain-containing protein n=1 Tax=Streptomyces clavuligerus TaxID=1901 RepID=E2Q8F4_STRCL|nr:DEAD/DEAH box helicase [Streptomyces clavuligerus]AXU16004.1 DEAD/DEAH box helicase [Streptomyces clavuligerus]EFG05486.1 DEAD/DEAH box helicase domain-containing protein [Streptomyces clavuligerus]MBY6306138.1 DEAD/DEAH box helicase [Streptomyces clavuligerus]QCS08783.1 DEAD/DEAH box helicase [Streptomyces clavuligerus]